jgi:hypothetical protein
MRFQPFPLILPLKVWHLLREHDHEKAGKIGQTLYCDSRLPRWKIVHGAR